MWITAPVSSAAFQNGSRSGASSTLPMPRGKVEIMAPRKPAAIAALSTAPARAPSCIGKVASGTKRGSALAAASSPSFISLHQVSPWSGGSSLPNQSGQPPFTCLSMPCLSIQASRPVTSLRPFMIGRLGLPPPKASDRPAGSSTIRSAGKRGPSLRMVARRSGGIMWPWVSMITGQAPFVFSRAAAIISPSRATLIGRELTTMPSGRTASLTALATAAGAPR